MVVVMVTGSLKDERVGRAPARAFYEEKNARCLLSLCVGLPEMEDAPERLFFAI